MKKKWSLTMLRLKAFVFTVLCFITHCAFAAETGVNSWEVILSKIANSLTGPVAYAISIMAIFLCGITMAFVDLSGGAKRFVQAGCGLSIAIFSSQILTSFMGFSGALI